VNDENRPSAERERAKKNIQELEKEQNEIENEREREMEQLPQVKSIFKKYGFTVTAVLLAVGTTIGVILSSLSSGLKGVSNGVGNGLKTLGKKLLTFCRASLARLSALVFVISFLGKHAWLLILAVAAFLFEHLMKRRD